MFARNAAMRVRGPSMRFASTSSTTQEVKEGAQKAAQKVKESAPSSAGPAIERAQSALSGVTEQGAKLYNRGSQLVGDALGSYREPIFHNAAVAKEVLKQVYVAEKLAPPSIAQLTSTYSNFFHSAQSMSFWRQILESGEWKRWAIYGIEAWGIFKIGEMIGRRHVVGYKLNEDRYAKTT